MRPAEIEATVLLAIDRLLAGTRGEDASIEFKREWPKDFDRAARQLAGHANAAQGEPILWVIGVDERSRAVVGTETVESSTWSSQLASRFAGTYPTCLRSLYLEAKGEMVCALLFETDRAPYVVKVSQDLLEVPWRELTRTRSARREDLVRILLPKVRLPKIQVVQADLGFSPTAKPSAAQTFIQASGAAWIIPQADRTVFALPSRSAILPKFSNGHLEPFVIDYLAIQGERDGDPFVPAVEIDRPTLVNFQGRTNVPTQEEPNSEFIELGIALWFEPVSAVTKASVVLRKAPLAPYWSYLETDSLLHLT